MQTLQFPLGWLRRFCGLEPAVSSSAQSSGLSSLFHLSLCFSLAPSLCHRNWFYLIVSHNIQKKKLMSVSMSFCLNNKEPKHQATVEPPLQCRLNVCVIAAELSYFNTEGWNDSPTKVPLRVTEKSTKCIFVTPDSKQLLGFAYITEQTHSDVLEKSKKWIVFMFIPPPYLCCSVSKLWWWITDWSPSDWHEKQICHVTRERCEQLQVHYQMNTSVLARTKICPYKNTISSLAAQLKQQSPTHNHCVVFT